MPNSVYNALKWTVQVILPTVSAAYFALSEVLGWGDAEKVLGALAVVTMLLGATLGLSSRRYYKSDAAYDGQLLTAEEDGVKKFSLELDLNPHEIAAKNSVSFRICEAPRGHFKGGD